MSSIINIENNIAIMNKKQMYESIMSKVAKEVKHALLEYNGSDAIEDAENSDWEDDSEEYDDILANGRGSKYYNRSPKNKAPMAGEITNSYPKLTFEKCFMMFDDGTGSVSVYGYDSIEDLCDLYGIEFDDDFYVNELDELEVGESVTDRNGGAIHTRIK